MDELLKSLPSLGVGGVIAAIIFYFYRKQSEEYAAAIKAEAMRNENFIKNENEVLRAQNETLINVVKENSRASTILSEVVRSLHEHLLFDQKLTERRAKEREGFNDNAKA